MRTLFLALLFTIGFAMPSSMLTSCCKDCGDPGPAFFDVTGIHSATHYLRLNTGGGQEAIMNNELVDFSRYKMTQIVLDVDYIAEVRQPQWDFSLIPSAMACDCNDYSGISGAKTDSLLSFSITSIDDYNTEIKAGDNASSLFDLSDVPEINKLVPTSYISIRLVEKPNHSGPVRFNIEINLSSGQQFSIETDPVAFQ